MNCDAVDDMADFTSKLQFCVKCSRFNALKMTPKGRTHTLTPLARHQNNELKQQNPISTSSLDTSRAML